MIKDKMKDKTLIKTKVKTLYTALLITLLTITLSASPTGPIEENEGPPADNSINPMQKTQITQVVPIERSSIDAAIEATLQALQGEANPDAAQSAKKQMSILLQVPKQLELLNRDEFFKPFNPQITGEIYGLLEQSAQVESDECHKLYLTELAENVRHDSFYAVTQDWLSLDKNVSEIIFVPNPVYENHKLFLTVFSPMNLVNRAAEMNSRKLSLHIREKLNAGKQNLPSRQSYQLFDTYIYVNDPKETGKYEEYTRLYGQMRDKVAGNRPPVVPFSGRPPAIKIANLAYADSTNQLSIVYPHPSLFYRNLAENPAEKSPYRLIIFRNLVDIYVSCILDPIARMVLQDTTIVPGLPDEPSPLSVPVEVTGDTFMSNHVMYSISQNIGNVFVLRPKNEPQNLKDDDDYTPKEKGAKPAYNEEKVLKLIPDVYKAQFPLMDGIKSTVISLYNTRLLMEKGLLPWEKEADIYATYLVTALDRIRRNPKRLGNKHHVIIFNYLLKNGGIFFNITTRKISINVMEFRKNLDALTEIVTEKYTFVYPSVREYDIVGSELEAIIKMLRVIPTITDVRFIN